MSGRRHGRRVGRAEARPAGPTPETAAKLRRDLLQYLLAHGRLRREHVDAGEEIRRIWEALSRGLAPSATDPAALAVTERRTRPLFQPIDLLSAAEESIWRRRYRPWAAEVSRIACGRTPGASRFRLVVDLAVDNRGLRQAEAWYRMRHGAALAELRAGLGRYAEIAGWLGPASSADAYPTSNLPKTTKNIPNKIDMGQNMP